MDAGTRGDPHLRVVPGCSQRSGVVLLRVDWTESFPANQITDVSNHCAVSTQIDLETRDIDYRCGHECCHTSNRPAPARGRLRQRCCEREVGQTLLKDG